MKHHIPSHLTISFFFILLTTLPQSYSNEEDTKYSVCSKPYNCGNVSNISYPFWGHNRPSYCGSTEQLKLNCEANQHTSFQSGSQNFTVLSIDTLSKTMRLVRTDIDYDDCSSDLTSTSLSPAIFEYPETMHNITVFYGCPTGFSLGGNNFTCKNDRTKLGFYVEMTEELLQQFPELERCAFRIHVLVYKKITLESDGGIDSLIQAAASGFDVYYNIAHNKITAQFARKLKEFASPTRMSYDSYFSSNLLSSNGGVRQLATSTPTPTPTPSRRPTPTPTLTPTPTSPSPRQSHHGTRSSLSPAPAPAPTSTSTPFFHNFPLPDFPDHPKTWEIIVTVAGTLIGLIIICLICTLSIRKRKSWLTAKRNNQDIEAFLRNHGGQISKRYKFSEVKKMTNSFKVKLGQGGFGAVYKGELLDGRLVAVKMLKASKRNGEEFINEVASISRTSHVNIVTLLGFCLEGSKRALIYEFMSNGSLEKFIYRKELETTPPLSWDVLYQIAIGIARGLEYLHRGCNTRILHFDIKPHNILLDENFNPKISDFGLAKLCPRQESIISMSDARGTLGYVAPEIFNRHFGGVSHKSDVYSYGMMLLEMVGGRKNIDAEASRTSEIYFPHWIYKRLALGMDLNPDEVLNVEENEIVKKMIVVGLWCVQTISNDRPTMKSVMEMLEGSINSLKMPPKPYLSSPTRSEGESSTCLN